MGHPRKDQRGTPRGVPRYSTPEIFEVTYPDPQRRASGETEAEAIGRVAFLSREEALAFRSRHGGVFSSHRASQTEKEQLFKLRGTRGQDNRDNKSS